MTYEEQEEHYKKQEEWKKRREAMEDAMPFLDFLKEKKEEIESLYHTNKTNHAYNDAVYMADRIMWRLSKEGPPKNRLGHPLTEIELLRHDKEELDKYGYKDSDKRKKEVINDFKNQILTDLHYMIEDREETAK